MPSSAWSKSTGWSGCYVGVNAGYGWGRDSVAADSVPEGDLRFDGALGGAQIGCDYQFAGPVLTGIEGMYDFADLRGDTVDPASPLGGPAARD
jgi:outer membrane immunogenic protein